MFTSPEAAQRIFASTSFSELFDPALPEPRARRLFRQLAAAVHPDRADGITADAAARATDLLLRRWQERTEPVAAPKRAAAAPFVHGAHGRYPLGDRLRKTDRVSVYVSGELRIVIARTTDDDPAAALTALGDTDALRYLPELMDSGAVNGLRWAATRVPDGYVSLTDVARRRPDGLDGRDWAWMARRFLYALSEAHAARTGHGGVDLDSLFIHPEGHNVLLADWCGGLIDTDMSDLGKVFQRILRAGSAERRQQHFAAASSDVGALRALGEYDLLLETLYGARRFRPFTL